jgi:hypothetical protein
MIHIGFIYNNYSMTNVANKPCFCKSCIAEKETLMHLKSLFDSLAKIFYLFFEFYFEL